MKRTLLAALACLVVGLHSAAAGASDSLVGFWLTQEGTSIVRVDQSGGRLSGRIVWLKEPTFPATEPDGRAGKVKTDVHNPDAAKRERPLLGLTILSGFPAANGQGVSEGGQVYDPRNGKTYSGTLTLAGNDRLNLRGYVLVSLIGRTSSWTRIDPGKYGLTP